jgi:TPR repeat protein
MRYSFWALILTLCTLGRAEASYEQGMQAHTSGDFTEALHQWMVTSDDPRCMTAIGALYDYGDGFPKDDVKAADWYKKAAEKGEYRAIAQLANFSLTGAGGVEQNPSEWRKKLEEIQGKDGYADYILASFCMDGYGGAQDLDKAQVLLRGLVDKGYTQLEAILRQAERRLADREAGVLEATTLTGEIALDGVSFDKAYKDRRIMISGWVNAVARLNDNGYVVQIGGEDSLEAPKDNIAAVFYDASRTGPPAELERGVFVKLDGVYVGKHPFPVEGGVFTLFGCSLTEVVSGDRRP